MALVLVTVAACSSSSTTTVPPTSSTPGADGGSTDPGQPGEVTQGKPTTLAATVVGAWTTTATNCQTGSDASYGYFLCPGGRIRGGGTIGNVTEVVCGSYTTAPASLPNCEDEVGCFPKVNANVTSTLVLGGQKDVDPNATKQFLYYESRDALAYPTQCKDGSAGLLLLERVKGGDSVSDDYCESDACTKGSSSSSQCGTDCDCGRCWFCESGTCRYGGEGPYGCYRGCSG